MHLNFFKRDVIQQVKQMKLTALLLL